MDIHIERHTHRQAQVNPLYLYNPIHSCCREVCGVANNYIFPLLPTLQLRLSVKMFNAEEKLLLSCMFCELFTSIVHSRGVWVAGELDE